MTNKLALFDCDGTMVDSQANICASMDQAFQKHGLVPPDHHLVRRIVGLSLIEAVTQLLPDGDEAIVAAVTQSYKDGFFELRQAGGVHEPLYDGLLQLLEDLEASGWVLGVATDTSFDMAMAVNAKVRAVGVNWGYHHEHELIDAGAEIVAATMADLNGILNR